MGPLHSCLPAAGLTQGGTGSGPELVDFRLLLGRHYTSGPLGVANIMYMLHARLASLCMHPMIEPAWRALVYVLVRVSCERGPKKSAEIGAH